MDTQDLPNNSAKRLLEILLKINYRGNIALSESITESFMMVFCNALDIEETSEIFYLQLGKLFILIEDLENDIQKLPKLKIKGYEKSLQKIKQWFSEEHHNVHWHVVNEHLRESDSLGFHMLYNCAIDLGEQEVIINQEQLTELKAQISSLLEKIIESDLSQPLKSLLREKLIELRKVVKDYQFYGADGIRKIAEESLGALIINSSEVKAEQDKKPVQDFFKLLKDILDIATKTKQLLPEGIGETLKNILPPG
ncbi:hypothetical protein [Crocosphaera chwakensis]|uniref:Uncharacterized protein n=1 Tax=Crocosphaera chwakensis CCY0110 TaxID=391612 RepID=A3IRW2_9CHRO|nr:hypothetical protein [Crocosphaera chwakensis]EAZ90813.1 hypothetical protein CY0110_30316 [Crocosphaera chwakensis CCY0110]